MLRGFQPGMEFCCPVQTSAISFHGTKGTQRCMVLARLRIVARLRLKTPKALIRRAEQKKNTTVLNRETH
jgi:hypothetical protein